ncbi:TetR/AcrR family transcriptional regulator [Paraburkholderia sp. BCC1885]|jgi:AcrR family transcriptional regulator|uniref:TetR/AcrR family transcriptional regulator n=1 Tax=Paraburkholderia sp. BCC1885 TaxID=2562669 RepID=UPI0011823811|nr:TetR/AcrR family transcriptional regulator [Paraburkholderia sp. BCC1885]
MIKRIIKGGDSPSTAFSLKMRFCPRKGRPSASMAGEVEERILDAATAVFLEYGFAGASLERIADRASASKATLYSRYENKEALFSAVVTRSVERSMRIIADTRRADSLLELLTFATRTLVTRLLSDEVIALTRVVVADAPRFPALAQLTHEAGRLRAIEMVTTLIAEHSQQPRAARSEATRKNHARVLATQILDSIVAPLLMRAMLGQNVDGVRSEIDSHIKRMLAIFVAAHALDPFQ